LVISSALRLALTISIDDEVSLKEAIRDCGRKMRLKAQFQRFEAVKTATITD